MKNALYILLKDVRQRLRDRTALMVGLVMPLLLAGLIGTALGGTEDGFRGRLAFADLDDSATSRAFVTSLERPDLARILELRPLDTAEAVRDAVDADDAEVGLVLPVDFERRVLAGEEVEIPVWADPDNGFASGLAYNLARGFTNRLETVRLARRVAGELGAEPPLAASALSLPGVPEIRSVSPGGTLRMIDFFGPSMAVLFLTLAVLTGVRAFQIELEAGTLHRLAATPVHPVSILAGKFGALLGIGLLQMTVVVLTTSLLFGSRWGDPFAVAALVGTSVLMAVGMSSFFVTLVNDATRGNTLATLAIFSLAAIGGQFFPPAGLPDVFDLFARLTPNGQAHRGFVDLAAGRDGGSLAAILEPLLVTGGVGLAGITFSVVRARRALMLEAS